jgi:hypothetical protein
MIFVYASNLSLVSLSLPSQVTPVYPLVLHDLRAYSFTKSFFFIGLKIVCCFKLPFDLENFPIRFHATVACSIFSN